MHLRLELLNLLVLVGNYALKLLGDQGDAFVGGAEALLRREELRMANKCCQCCRAFRCCFLKTICGM